MRVGGEVSIEHDQSVRAEKRPAFADLVDHVGRRYSRVGARLAQAAQTIRALLLLLLLGLFQPILQNWPNLDGAARRYVQFLEPKRRSKLFKLSHKSNYP